VILPSVSCSDYSEKINNIALLAFLICYISGTGQSVLLHTGGSAVEPGMLGSLSGASPAYVEMVTEINNEVSIIASKSEAWTLVGVTVSHPSYVIVPCGFTVEELQRIHAQRLRVGFDQDAEREKVIVIASWKFVSCMHFLRILVCYTVQEREIEITTAEITRKFMQCGNRLKKIAGVCWIALLDTA
jgi:hypothetical protein